MIISFFLRDHSRIIVHGDRRCVASQSSNPKTELTCVNRSPTTPTSPPPPPPTTIPPKKQILEQSKGPIFLDQLPSNVGTKTLNIIIIITIIIIIIIIIIITSKYSSYQNVFRLQVPVHNFQRMYESQTIGDLSCPLEL